MKETTFSITSIATKVTSLLRPRRDAPPVFNKPLNTNASPHHRIARIFYAIFLMALIAISVPVVALRALTYTFIEDNRMQGFVFETSEKDGSPGVQIAMAALPRMLYDTPAKVALIAAVISIFLGATHLGFVATDWKSGKRTQTYAFRRNIMFLQITNAIVILFALVSIYITHKSTSHFREGYVRLSAAAMKTTPDNSSETYFRYNIGRFDLETWACELRDVRGAAMVKDDYGQQCDIEIAGRAVMIPMVIVAWLIAGVGIWGLVGGGRRGPDGERMKTEDVGLELRKMGAE